MTRLLLVLLAASTVWAAPPAVEVGGRYLRVQPSDTRSAGGVLELRPSMGFAMTAEVFWSERFSTPIAATFVQPEAIFSPADVDLGTLGLTPIVLTGRYHFTSQSRFTPFAGAGAAVVLIGNIDDYFGDAIEAEFDPKTAFIGEGGVRFRTTTQLSFDFSVAYMPLSAELKVRRSSDPRVTLPDRLKIDPLMVSVGVSWRLR